MKPSREWLGRSLVLAVLVATVALPFVLRTDEAPALVADDKVVIITPHNEAIRSEFARGFAEWYRTRHGRTIAVDWRVIGGTSEIARYLDGEYTQSFRLHWTRDLRRPWTAVVEQAFDNPAIRPDDTPEDDTEAEAARRAFLASDASCGIDLFFGGGSFDFIRQAAAGRIVDSGIFERQPRWFGDRVFPQQHNGEIFWAKDRTWVGAVIASFGILYNRDSIARLGIEREPTRWRDLADPRLIGELALADPTKSSSIAKAFEMVLQQEMQIRLRELREAGVRAAEAEERAVREGWIRGFQLLQLMGANARYFTDSSQKPPIDISQGDSAAGMCIDFYGRYQAEAVRRRDDSARLEYVTPTAGSVFNVDPIATLRGAPRPGIALDFIEYVLSPEGQNLWNFKVGTPGGPTTFALRRLPVRKDSYAPDLDAFRSDPGVNPYAPENDFVYHPEWTGGVFREMAFLIRVMCLDPHHELVRAWRAVIEAGFPAEAMAILQDVSSIDYERTNGPIRTALRSGNPIDEVRLAKELANGFRRRYERAAEIARAVKVR
jgi:ABC-type Fe3+ transport system substrate-binding protein